MSPTEKGMCFLEGGWDERHGKKCRGGTAVYTRDIDDMSMEDGMVALIRAILVSKPPKMAATNLEF